MENLLVSLLEYDKFDMIKELLRNRLKIVWCIRLERAENDDRARLEVALDQISCFLLNTQARPYHVNHNPAIRQGACQACHSRKGSELGHRV